MKTLLLLFLSVVVVVNAFVPQVQRRSGLASVVALEASGYVPDGMTPAQYQQLKKREESEKAQKKFGAFGPQSFKSRSLQAFQQDLEQGKANHLMPVLNAKERVKRGEIKEQDIPYMQRLGSWDDSDVRGAKKKEWTSTDKYYQEKGTPAFRLDWGGNQQRRGGPGAATAAKPQQQKTTTAAAPKKKGGLFSF